MAIDFRPLGVRAVRSCSNSFATLSFKVGTPNSRTRLIVTLLARPETSKELAATAVAVLELAVPVAF